MESLGKLTPDNGHKWKNLIRGGVPDIKKRACILQYFNVKEADAVAHYAHAKKLAGEDMLRICEESRVA